MNIGELLAMKFNLHDRKDELNADLSAVNKSIADVDAALMKQLRESGQTKASDDRVTVSVKTGWRAKYDPEQWPAIMEELVKSGHGHIIQRRLTDAKVVEMAENGVALPAGLSLESFDNLSFKRLTSAALPTDGANISEG